MLNESPRPSLQEGVLIFLSHPDGVVVDGGALVGAHMELGQLVGAEMVDV